jgi:hypothetical protein
MTGEYYLFDGRWRYEVGELRDTQLPGYRIQPFVVYVETPSAREEYCAQIAQEITRLHPLPPEIGRDIEIVSIVKEQ